MTGELISTGITFGTGREALNDAFSGTAEFNNVALDSGGNLSGGTGGGILFSGGTDLYNIFITTDGNDITRVQPGTNITTGGTENLPIVNLADDITINSLSATTISGDTIYSGSTPIESIINSFSGTSGNLWSASTGINSIIANNGGGDLASGDYSVILGGINHISISDFSSIMGGSGHSISSQFSSIIGGEFGTLQASAENSIILGGSGHTISGLNFSSILGGINNVITFTGGPPITYYSSAIIAGSGNTIPSSQNSVILGGRGNSIAGLKNSVILGGENISITSSNTAGMQIAYIDEYIDLNPQIILPSANQGRIFFSGGSLNRLMYNTGGTAADWIIV